MIISSDVVVDPGTGGANEETLSSEELPAVKDGEETTTGEGASRTPSPNSSSGEESDMRSDAYKYRRRRSRAVLYQLQAGEYGRSKRTKGKLKLQKVIHQCPPNSRLLNLRLSKIQLEKYNPCKRLSLRVWKARCI